MNAQRNGSKTRHDKNDELAGVGRASRDLIQCVKEECCMQCVEEGSAVYSALRRGVLYTVC